MEEEKPGWGMPIAWLALGLLFLCGGGASVAIAAYGSETAGVQAATFAAGPMGFGAAGALGALVTHFVAKGAGARMVAPAGCGCLGALAALAATLVFFGAIFPAL